MVQLATGDTRTMWVVTEHADGRKARADIVAEIRRREAAGELAPTASELAPMLGTSRQTALYHVRILVRQGVLRWERVSTSAKVLRLAKPD